MSERRHTLRLPTPTLQADQLGFFRWGPLGDRMVITTDAGEWALLHPAELADLLAGRVVAGHPRHAELRDLGVLRAELDAEAMASKVRRKKAFLGQGPHLHIVITTLRCNQSCRYCHASRTDMDRVDTDMSIETAKGVVDLALKSTSPYINFEFTGGEPTVNMPVLEFVVDYAREKNRTEGKQLDFSVVTNMTWMDEAKAKYLLENDIWVCTSLDGPKAVHDWNRGWSGGAAFDHVVKWIQYFNQRYVDMGRDPELFHVDALMTTTRRNLSQGKELVDLYRSLGIRNIHVRPLNPFGFAAKTWGAIGYSTAEYMAWYQEVFDYILDLNLQGEQVMEGTARLVLKKMLTPDDPNFVDLRSPMGSGIGQLAYSYDGRIYTSDEGRMVAGMGSDAFCVGKVGENTMDELVTHPTVRAMAAASYLDSLPQCASCWNVPFCGVRPTHNWMNTGDLFGQRPNTPKCHEQLGISTLLLDKLRGDKDGKIESIFRRWVIDRARPAAPDAP